MRAPNLAALVVLAACIPPEERLRMQSMSAREIVCTVGPECDAMWGTAVLAVSNLCKWKIQTQTDYFISTFGPTRSSEDAAAQVNLVPLGDGRARVVVQTLCAGALFCDDNALRLKHGIVHLILDARPLPHPGR